ncbi:MAG: hypothetical protein EOP10_25165 [Proteobacteria bacterium]|nr:MAG: hypothetical protein EOP10_25165 [Pseudomonadota bacterium]
MRSTKGFPGNGKAVAINHRRISLAVASSFLLELVSKISPLLILHHAQKTLGIEQYGWSQTQIAFLETMQPFITFGFASYALAITSGKGDAKDDLNRLFSPILYLKTFNALIVALVYLAYFLWRGNVLNVLDYLVFGVMLLTSVLDFHWVCVVRHKIAMVSLVSGALRLAFLGLILTLVKSSDDKSLFVALLIIPNAFVAMGTGYFAKSLAVFRVVKWEELRRIFLDSIPFAILIIMITTFDRVDLFSVERWLGLEIVGIYSGPAKVIQSISTVLMALSLPFFAEILKVTDSDSLTKHLRLSFFFMSVLISTIIFGMPFVEKDIAQLMFPAVAYESVRHLMSILSVSMVGSIFISVFGLQLLMSKGKPWPIIRGTFVYCLFFPIFVWAFGQSHGQSNALKGRQLQ